MSTDSIPFISGAPLLQDPDNLIISEAIREDANRLSAAEQKIFHSKIYYKNEPYYLGWLGVQMLRRLKTDNPQLSEAASLWQVKADFYNKELSYPVDGTKLGGTVVGGAFGTVIGGVGGCAAAALGGATFISGSAAAALGFVGFGAAFVFVDLLDKNDAVRIATFEAAGKNTKVPEEKSIFHFF